MWLMLLGLIKLIAAEPGFLSNRTETVYYSLGRTINLTCEYYQTVKPYNIIWMLKDKIIKNSSLVTISEYNQPCSNKFDKANENISITCYKSVLTIKHYCDIDDEVYFCHLVQTNGTLTYNSNRVQYRILEEAEKKILFPKYVSVCEGESYKLQCDIENADYYSKFWIGSVSGTKQILNMSRQINRWDPCLHTVENLTISNRLTFLFNVTERVGIHKFACYLKFPTFNNVVNKEMTVEVVTCSNSYILITCMVLLVCCIVTCIILLVICTRLSSTRSSLIRMEMGDYLKILHCIGSGEFGEVYLGILVTNKGVIQVAIKCLKRYYSVADQQSLLSEINTMKALDKHDNVVSYYGYKTDNDGVKLIMEYVPNGCLLNLLNDSKQSNSLTNNDLIKFSLDVASGMVYLSSKKVVHRDLACRNVLVSNENILKISDFGMSRISECYYRPQSKYKIPVRWMAPESLNYYIYSTFSDAWSFGILMWEIFSMGKVPYHEVEDLSQLSVLIGQEGYRNSKPDRASDEVYQIMLDCWKLFPHHRPLFPAIKLSLSQLLKTADSTCLR